MKRYCLNKGRVCVDLSNRVPVRYFSAHSLVAEIYPIGASNKHRVLCFHPLEQERESPIEISLLLVLSPSSSQDLTCLDWVFSHLRSFRIHQKVWYRSKGKTNVVALVTGTLPVSVEVGLIRSVALSERPQDSH